VVPSLYVIVEVSETGVPAWRISMMALLESGDELALATSRRASALSELGILPA